MLAGVEISVRTESGTELHTQRAWSADDVEELWRRWLADGGELAAVPMPEGWRLVERPDATYEARSLGRVFVDERLVVVVTCAWEQDDEPAGGPMSASWFVLIVLAVVVLILLASAFCPGALR